MNRKGGEENLQRMREIMLAGRKTPIKEEHM